MSILLQKKNVGDYSYMSSPNIYYRAKMREAFREYTKLYIDVKFDKCLSEYIIQHEYN